MSKTKQREYDTIIRARVTHEQKSKLKDIINARQTTYSDLIREFIDNLSENTKSKKERLRGNA